MTKQRIIPHFEKKDLGSTIPQEFIDALDHYFPEIELKKVETKDEENDIWLVVHEGALMACMEDRVVEREFINPETEERKTFYGVELVLAVKIDLIEQGRDEEASEIHDLFAVTAGDAALHLMGLAPNEFLGEKLERLFRGQANDAEHSIWHAFSQTMGMNIMAMMEAGKKNPKIAHKIFGRSKNQKVN